jgi:hypothetical protein
VSASFRKGASQRQTDGDRSQVDSRSASLDECLVAVVDGRGKDRQVTTAVRLSSLGDRFRSRISGGSGRISRGKRLTDQVKRPALKLLEGLDEDSDESLDVERGLLGTADDLAILGV